MVRRTLCNRIRAIQALALVTLLVWHSVAIGMVAAQTQDQDSVRQTKGGNPTTVIIASRDDYVIGVSDVLEIIVEKAPELSGNLRVSSKGTIPMPFLGAIETEGKTPEQLGQYIADRLRDRYLKNPIVTVTVKQYNSRSFFVQGAVRSPGVYYIDGRLTLYKLITIAGGLVMFQGETAYEIREVKPSTTTESAVRDGEGEPGARHDNHVVEEDRVARPVANRKPPGKYEMIAVNIGGLMTGHFEKNLELEAGDLVNIPPADVFFVAGEVKAPGQFQLKPGTTLRQAIALAQGPTISAAKGNSKIYRENQETGAREELPVDIGAVMNGKHQDIPIRANDIIIVPNSAMKSAGVALLRAFGLSIASVRYY